MIKSLILDDYPDEEGAFPTLVTYINDENDNFLVITHDEGQQTWLSRNEAQQLTNWLNDAMVENDGGR